MIKEKPRVGRAIALFLTVAALSAYTAAIFIARLRSLGEPSAGDAVKTALATLISFFVFYLLHNALHELMHSLFCVCSGGRVAAIAFWGVRLSFVKGDKRLSFLPRSGYAGWTEFSVKDPSRAHVTLLFATLGGLFGTVLTAAAAVAIYLSAKGTLAGYFAAAGAVPVAFMFVINFVVGGSDGKTLLSAVRRDKTFAAAASRLETEAYLAQGKRLSEAKPVKMAELFGATVTGYDYLSALGSGDLSAAENALDELEKNGDNGVIDPFIERFFLSVVQKKEAKAIPFYIEEEADKGNADALRASCAFRFFTGDEAWGEILKERYFRECEKLGIKGLADAYERIGRIYFEK